MTSKKINSDVFRTPKTFLFLILAFMFATNFGCTAYKQVSMQKSDFMQNKQIQASLQDYTIYLHDAGATYLMENATIVDAKNLSADIKAAVYDAPKENWKRHERKEWWKAHKYDIHIYTHEDAKTTASLEGVIDLLHDHVILADELIQDIKVMALDKEKGISDAMIVIVVVTGALLVTLTMLLVASSAVNGSGGGGSNSGGSDSGSDSGGSDSGGSDSGGSDSGGSDSGS